MAAASEPSQQLPEPATRDDQATPEGLHPPQFEDYLAEPATVPQCPKCQELKLIVRVYDRHVQWNVSLGAPPNSWPWHCNVCTFDWYDDPAVYEQIRKAAAAEGGEFPDVWGDAERVAATEDGTPISPEPKGNGQSLGDAERLELGKWGHNRLEEARRFSRLVRCGRSPESLRAELATLFTGVIDLLQEPKREHLYVEAQRRRMRNPELMELIAEVKYLSGSTLADYRKEYLRKLRSTGAPKP